MKEGGQCLRLSETNLKQLSVCYKRNLDTFKNASFGKHAHEIRIDQHKIAAVYIQSILECKPFCIDVTEWDSTKKCRLRMEPHYKNCFLQLMHHYLKHPESLDIIGMAHIIYFIEHQFFHPV
ncbi:MAG: hypothetical protein LBR47_02825 [Spirochaetaceae bacterium]|nr:hypothetical protein [Spirochaetaceae bacterium]